MSLLLDALKRAEQEKLARQPGGQASPEPPAAPRMLAGTGPASLELQPLASAANAPAHAAAHRADPAAQAAQNVFQAKAASAAPEPARNRTMLWVALGAIAVVAIAAGSYVWYSVTALTPKYAGAPRPRPVPPAAPASGVTLPPAGATGSVVPAAPQGAPTLPVEMPPAAPTPPPASAAPVAPAPAPRAPVETPGERLAREAAGAPVAPPLRMERLPEPARRIPAEVSSGYLALQHGDFAAARRSYEAALASDPTSVDAHLGLATIAAREANRANAAVHYRRALDLDPRNATALAGLAALADFARPDALEAQLQSDLARMPESAALHFALGSLHASQAHWQQAQAAFYEAHRLDPGSADVAYDLAVSLDHLGQSRLAAGFYRRALEAARGRAAQFDPAAVVRRLREIE